MKQYIKKYSIVLLLGIFAWLVPGKAWATWYDSNNSGNWTTTTIWTPNGVPASGDQLRINNGHTITYTGNLNWSSGTIQIATGGTLIVNGTLTLDGASLNSLAAGANLVVNGNLTYSGTLNSSSNITVTGSVNVTGSFNSSGQITVGTSMTVNGNISSSANIDVADDLTVGGSISMSSGLLHVGSDLSITNQLSVASNLVVDVDGSLSVNNLDFSTGSLIVVDNDLTVQNRLGTGNGKIVVGGDYFATASTNTWLNQNQMYVFGSNNCTNGNCSYILNETDWTNAGSPGSTYLTTSPSWWEDHLANVGEDVGPVDVCQGAVSTFSLSAVTLNTGAMSSNQFEWAVYGGTITGFNGTSVESQSESVDGHSASIQTINGLDGVTNYSLTVTWENVTFSGAYVAVRQSSVSGCTDGLWSVFRVNVEAGTLLTVPPFLSGNTVACIPEFDNYADFQNAAILFPTVFSAGGTATSNCSSMDASSFSYEDVYENTTSCPKTVTRTYRILDGNGTEATATQVFILNDSTDPVINGGVGLDPISTTAVGDGCTATLTIPEPSIVDCGLGTIDVDYSAGSVALTYDETNREVTGDFPIGDTELV